MRAEPHAGEVSEWAVKPLKTAAGLRSCQTGARIRQESATRLHRKKPYHGARIWCPVQSDRALSLGQRLPYSVERPAELIEYEGPRVPDFAEKRPADSGSGLAGNQADIAAVRRITGLDLCDIDNANATLDGKALDRRIMHISQTQPHPLRRQPR